MKRRHALVLPCLAFAVILLAAPTAGGQEHRSESSAPLHPGVIFIVDGVGGLRLMHLSGLLGFRQAGLTHEIRPFPWSHGLGRTCKIIAMSSGRARSWPSRLPS